MPLEILVLISLPTDLAQEVKLSKISWDLKPIASTQSLGFLPLPYLDQPSPNLEAPTPPHLPINEPICCPTAAPSGPPNQSPMAPPTAPPIPEPKSANFSSLLFALIPL